MPCDTFDTIGVSEEAAVRVLYYIIAGVAKDVLAEKWSLIEVDFDGGFPKTSYQGSCPHLIEELLRRLVT